MSLSVWTEPSGYNLGYTPGFGVTVHSGDVVIGKEYVIVTTGSTNWIAMGATSNQPGTIFKPTEGQGGTGTASETIIRESVYLNQNLPVINDTGVSYSVISGKLPPGIRISGNMLTGTPFQVADFTTFQFCIRATKDGEISDRTFLLTVDGPDAPEFTTLAGRLDIGVHHQMYVLDKTYTEYQIEAFDIDTSAGQKLRFFIASGDGSLPPGLTMDENGFISGFIKPNPKITPNDGSGTYDNTYYDKANYDFAIRPSNGFDSFVYDRVFYDYFTPTSKPTTLNINYQFKVTLTDGNTVAQRIFKIFVIGDDQFRADSTLNDGIADGLYTSDVTYLRQPAWLSNSNIGLFRANNYLTVPLVLHDSTDVFFKLNKTNQEFIGTSINLLETDNVENSNKIAVKAESGIPEGGYYIQLQDFIEGASSQLYRVTAVQNLGNNDYRLTITPNLQNTITEGTTFNVGTLSTLPNGTSFDVQTATIYGAVPYQPAITKVYNFTISAFRIGNNNEVSTANKTFTIRIIGEIDSVIAWNSDSNLGTINANYISNLKISATSSITNAIVLYNLVSGKLPPGLTLDPSGDLVGKVNQFYEESTGTLGLTRFYDAPPNVPTKVFTTFDNNTTTIDRSYTFEVEARDQYDYSATTRKFTLSVATPNTISFSNIRTKPFLKQDQRSLWKSFINDPSIFNPESIYRTNDPNFGVQSNLEMLIFAGIETRSAAEYISAIGLNHKRKKFIFGSLKSAVAYYPGTYNTAYEVVYIEMVDPLEINGKYLPEKIKTKSIDSTRIKVDNSNSFWSRNLSDLNSDAPDAVRPEPRITADSTGYQVSNSQVNTYFPSSISIWQNKIKNIGLVERNYLPLWMRTIQPGSSYELGFVLAVPICYCKEGNSSSILLNIKHSNFDFKIIDYTVDRYIIDSTAENNSDKYLVFKNDRITV
mgnify:CR=1 FL=1